MSDDRKETVVEHSADSKEFAHSADDVYNGNTGSLARPAGWMYKGYTPFGRNFELWYASPKVQLLMISFVCFLCPGMFNALNGLGGAGLPPEKAYVGANCSVALYSTFAVFGFFAGTITNRLGLRPSLAFGGLGYCIYAASFLSYKHTANEGFVYFAGAFLGVCAGILWCAQGAIMMAYPREESKGRYISVFWIIFNFGGVIGSLVSLLFTCCASSLTGIFRFLWPRLSMTSSRTKPPTVSTLLLSSSWSSVLSSPFCSATVTRLFVRMAARLS